jgi:putative thioredoxin
MNNLPKIVDVNIDNFVVEVLEKSKDIPVLVDFTADWCAPCRVMAPILTQLAENSQGQFIIATVDTDEQQKLAGQHGIRGLPTFKLFKQGQVVEETFGAQSEVQLRKMIERHS